MDDKTHPPAYYGILTYHTFADFFEQDLTFKRYQNAKRHDQILTVLRFANYLARIAAVDERGWVSISELLDPRIKLHTVAQAKQYLGRLGRTDIQILQKYMERAPWDPKVPDRPEHLISKWRIVEDPQGELEV